MSEQETDKIPEEKTLPTELLPPRPRERMSFREVIELVKGSQDIEKRARVILDPKRPETTSYLTGEQVSFVVVSKSVAEYFPELEPLEKFADMFLLVSESKDGWGVEKVIQHEQALNEKRLFELGFRQRDKEVKKGRLGRVKAQ